MDRQSLLALSFWVHRGQTNGGQTIGVQLSDVVHGWDWRHRAHFTVPEDDEWHQVVIPLSDLDGIDMQLSRLAMIGNGQDTETILFRNTPKRVSGTNANRDCRSIIRLTGIQNLAGRCKPPSRGEEGSGKINNADRFLTPVRFVGTIWH
jgi:hypothetical protein